MTNKPQDLDRVIADLDANQRIDLDLLCYTSGRLTTRAFESLPAALVRPVYEGGLFPQAYPSPLGLAVRSRLQEQHNRG